MIFALSAFQLICSMKSVRTQHYIRNNTDVDSNYSVLSRCCKKYFDDSKQYLNGNFALMYDNG